MKQLTAPLWIFLLCLSSCAPAARVPPVSNEEALHEIRLQKEIAVKERMEQLKRLHRVGLPVLAANAPLCGSKIWPHLGIMVESLSNVPEDLKDGARIYYGLQNQLTVGYVDPVSPAHGKLAGGDMITAVSGIPVRSGAKGRRDFYEALWSLRSGTDKTIVLTVQRGRNNTSEKISILAPPGCASVIALETDDAVNAHADGANIIFSSGMMRDAKDDNMLAYVFGHELAHNARLHIESKQMNRLLASVAALVIEAGTGMDFSDILEDLGASAWSQDFESEADYIGLYMMARAGYDPAEGIQFARRLAALYPDTIHLAGGSHPSSAKRFVALNKTLAEIRAAKSNGRPLIPLEQ